MANDGSVKILVVDDLPDRILVFESVLEELGHEVITASSGWEALKLVLLHDFAVILLDVNMPGMDGFETAALIRGRKKTQHIPIIFITAYADEIQTERGYSIGAVDYILTPVVPEILRSKVRVFAELFRMQQLAKRQADERIALAEERLKREAAEQATRRSAFLAEASAALASSLHVSDCLSSLARLTVPFLSDFLIVTLFEEHRSCCTTFAAWSDPGLRGDGDTLTQRGSGERQQLEMNDIPAPFKPAIEQVRSSGRTLLLSEMKGDVLPGIAAGLSAQAAMVLPLFARGQISGAFILGDLTRSGLNGTSPQGRPFPRDAALIEDVVGRAAISLDNARLYQSITEADKRKNEFLAMLAHELRNPLAPIRTALDLLRLRGGGSSEGAWAQDVIHRQLSHLVRLVDDLLDVSRITGGKIRLQLECVDASAAIANAVETSRPLIEAHGHKLQVRLPAEAIFVQADTARLSQILSNLLNNAAKYTPDGGTIELSLKREGGDAVFSVRDSGVGIPPEMLARVFDLFTQVDRSLDRSQGGLGIGLTLVRRLVELHGGTVQAASAGANQGSEFIVRLPLVESGRDLQRRRSAAEAQIIDASGACVRRVLVVDDNVDAAGSLGLLLELGGHEVRIAHDGSQALAQAADFHPDVVLLDIGLPGMDGYAVAKAIRENPLLASAQLIAVSGYGQDEDRKRSHAAGFDHHLVKPVDLGALSALLTTQ